MVAVVPAVRLAVLSTWSLPVMAVEVAAFTAPVLLMYTPLNVTDEAVQLTLPPLLTPP